MAIVDLDVCLAGEDFPHRNLSRDDPIARRRGSPYLHRALGQKGVPDVWIFCRINGSLDFTDDCWFSA